MAELNVTSTPNSPSITPAAPESSQRRDIVTETSAMSSDEQSPSSTPTSSPISPSFPIQAKPPLPIIILGAGPAGLSLAQTLLHNPLPSSPPIHIFERDSGPSVRRQGYRVRLASIAISCLRELLPPSVFAELEATKAILPPGTRMVPPPDSCFDARTGERLDATLLKGKANGPALAAAGSPLGMDGPIWAVDRATLRAVLMRGLEDRIQWGREVVNVQDKGSGQGIVVSFRDGAKIRGRLVVGADGVNSKVRQAVSPHMPILDTGGRWIFGRTIITEELEKKCGSALDRLTALKDQAEGTRPKVSGVMEAMRFKRPIKGLVPCPDDYVYWVLQTRQEFFAEQDDALLRLSGNEAADVSRTIVDEWHPRFKALFDLQDEASATILRVATAPPKIPYWKPSMMTLIGDAAHVMSPTAAVGATSAFRDALGLAKVLRELGLRQQSVSIYEEQMRIYAGQGIQMSMMSGKWLFGMKSWEEMEPIRNS